MSEIQRNIEKRRGALISWGFGLLAVGTVVFLVCSEPLFGLKLGIALSTVIWIGLMAAYVGINLIYDHHRKQALPPSQQKRDPRPPAWRLVKELKSLKDLTTQLPDLAVEDEKGKNRLWSTTSIGPNGAWKLSVDEREGKIVGYLIKYEHQASTVLDCEEEWATLGSRYFSNE